MSLLINSVVVIVLIFTINLKNVGANPIETFANSDVTSRVSGGLVAKVAQFPFMAGLWSTAADNTMEVCGGALISLNTILTSAFCLHGKTIIYVTLGTTDLTQYDDDRMRQSFVTNNTHHFIFHPNFDGTKRSPNLAVIKLTNAAKFSHYVQPVNLPRDDTDQYAKNRHATVFGWGQHTSESTYLTYDTLRYVANRILANENCENTPLYKDKGIINDALMCLSGYQGKGICHGDNGSPLVLNSLNLLVGVASIGTEKCGAVQPTVFTRVSKYLQWINDNSH